MFPSARLHYQFIDKAEPTACGFESGVSIHFRCSVGAVAGAVEGIADDVAEQCSPENLNGVGTGIDDINERVGGDDEAEQRGR